MTKTKSLIALGMFAFFLGLFLWWQNCGACLQKQDFLFMDSVKAALDSSDGRAKVEQIHSGEWKKVCVYSYINADFRKSGTPDKPKNIILNENRAVITDTYDESAILFDYGPNIDGAQQIEIYRSTQQYITFTAPDDNCYDRQNAYLSYAPNGKSQEKSPIIELTNKSKEA